MLAIWSDLVLVWLRSGRCRRGDSWTIVCCNGTWKYSSESWFVSTCEGLSRNPQGLLQICGWSSCMYHLDTSFIHLALGQIQKTLCTEEYREKISGLATSENEVHLSKTGKDECGQCLDFEACEGRVGGGNPPWSKVAGVKLDYHLPQGLVLSHHLASLGLPRVARLGWFSKICTFKGSPIVELRQGPLLHVWDCFSRFEHS